MSNPIKTFIDRIVYQGLESFGRHYSSYRGFVMSSSDPKGLDRLFVYVPHVSGLKKEGSWAWPKGKPNELSLLPKKGDMVWVEFEHGDYRYPIWSFSNQMKELRNKTNPIPKPGDLKWKTESGHEIWLNESEGKINFTHRNGSTIGILENNDTDEISINHHDGTHIILKDGGILLNGKDNKGLIKIDELINKLNRLEQHFLTHIHTSPAGPTGTPQKPSQEPITFLLTTQQDLENPKVKH